MGIRDLCAHVIKPIASVERFFEKDASESDSPTNYYTSFVGRSAHRQQGADALVHRQLTLDLDYIEPVIDADDNRIAKLPFF